MEFNLRVAPCQGFEAITPKALFGVRVGSLTTNPYDITPDGQQFLVSSITDIDNAPINVVLNWTAVFGV